MSYFNAKMHLNRFRLKLHPRTRCGSLQRSSWPILPSWHKGDLLLREGRGAGERRQGRRKEEKKGETGAEGKEKGQKGEGREPMCVSLTFP